MSQKTVLIGIFLALCYLVYYMYDRSDTVRSRKAPKPETQGG